MLYPQLKASPMAHDIHELLGSYSITTVTIENSIYALIAAREDNGVQIINITDPYNPTNASSITDGTRYPELDRPHSITTVTIEGSTYALVASFVTMASKS